MNDKPIKLLLVEDNPGDVRLIKEQLAEANDFFEIICVDLISKGIDYIIHHDFDAVLLDLGLPDSQGIRNIENMLTAQPSIPLVVLTGFDDENTAIEAVHRGAQDYLIKGSTDGKMLARVIRYAIERKNTEEELKQSLQKLTLVLGKTVKAMAKAVEIRDPYTAGHQKRGAVLARAISQEMNLSPKSLKVLNLPA